jgi:hypothetical protein
MLALFANDNAMSNVRARIRSTLDNPTHQVPQSATGLDSSAPIRETDNDEALDTTTESPARLSQLVSRGKVDPEYAALLEELWTLGGELASAGSHLIDKWKLWFFAKWNLWRNLVGIGLGLLILTPPMLWLSLFRPYPYRGLKGIDNMLNPPHPGAFFFLLFLLFVLLLFFVISTVAALLPVRGLIRKVAPCLFPLFVAASFGYSLGHVVLYLR